MAGVALLCLALMSQEHAFPSIEGKWISVGIRVTTLTIKKTGDKSYSVDAGSQLCFGDANGHYHGKYVSGVLTLNQPIEEATDYDSAKLYVEVLPEGTFLVRDKRLASFKTIKPAFGNGPWQEAVRPFAYAYARPGLREKILGHIEADLKSQGKKSVKHRNSVRLPFLLTFRQVSWEPSGRGGLREKIRTSPANRMAIKTVSSFGVINV